MKETYREEMFVCRRDNLQIKGMQFIPNHKLKEKCKAIIVCHGFTGDYTNEIPLCVNLAERGYAAFCFSFCGGSKHTTDDAFKSDGKTTETTLWTQVADLLAVKEYVKQQDYVDEQQIILMGESQGGVVAGLTAAKCGSEISALVMFFPALCIPDHARRGCLGGADYDVHQVPEVLECPNIQLGKIFHDTVVNMDIYQELSGYHGSTLIIQGADDKVVNFSYAIRAKENYAPGQCHLQLVPNMGHGMTDEQRESAVESIHQYLMGKREVLTVRVICTSSETVECGDDSEQKIYFTGYCETGAFKGTVLSGGCDTIRHCKNGEVHQCADYTLEGFDAEKQLCRIHITNRRVEGDWKPIIKTDSKALSWMENADTTAILDMSREGPIVRFYMWYGGSFS